jgi:hypothetical protein
MEDGRHFTDYRPRCAVNYDSQPRPMSAYEYRMYLTEHAEDMMKKSREVAYKKNSCEPCENRTVFPDNVIAKCNTRTCAYAVIDSSKDLGDAAFPFDGNFGSINGRI